MRFFEFSGNPAQGPENAFITVLSYLKGKGDRHSAGIRVPIESIAKLMGNLGFSIGFSEIQSMQDSNETIKNLIKDLDNDNIVIATQNDLEGDSDEIDAKPGDENKPTSQHGDEVNKMAKRAANKREI